MIALQQILLGMNVLVAVLFGIDYFIIDSPGVKPRTKAKTGVLLGVLFFAFLVLLLLFAVLSAVLKHNALYLALSIFVAVPLAIGRLASYRTLKFYTVVQILTLLLSAASLCVI